MFNIKTRSGGEVNLGITSHVFNGLQAVINIDQSSNIKNGENEASLVMTLEELILLKQSLDIFIEFLDKNRGL